MVKEELLQKYNIDLEVLKKEQIKLAKTLYIKDDFGVISTYGAIENMMIGNKIVSSIVVIDKDNEIVDQTYFVDKLRFPYIFGFKAYRELASMTGAYNKLSEKPDIVLIFGEGINHERLGIASHFSILAGVPTIGVSDNIYEGNSVVGVDVMNKGKKVGKMFRSKEGSRPLYIVPGNKISIDSASELVKGLVQPPHKLPEPMHLVHKYARSVKKEAIID